MNYKPPENSRKYVLGCDPALKDYTVLSRFERHLFKTLLHRCFFIWGRKHREAE